MTGTLLLLVKTYVNRHFGRHRQSKNPNARNLWPANSYSGDPSHGWGRQVNVKVSPRILFTKPDAGKQPKHPPFKDATMILPVINRQQLKRTEYQYVADFFLKPFTIEKPNEHSPSPSRWSRLTPLGTSHSDSTSPGTGCGWKGASPLGSPATPPRPVVPVYPEENHRPDKPRRRGPQQAMGPAFLKPSTATKKQGWSERDHEGTEEANER